jgi:hypothetical protein
MSIGLGTRFRIGMEDAFAHGAFFRTVEPDNDFDLIRARAADPQKRDKETGERLWVVTVLDGDPEARTAEVKVRIASNEQPVAPTPASGMPFPQVEFANLTVMPWVDGQRCRNRRPDDRDCRGRVAYSLRASDMRAVSPRPAAPAKAGAQ